MKSNLNHLLSLTFLFIAACAPVPEAFQSDSDPFEIVGGNVTANNTEIAQHLVMIYIEKTKLICTGTIIHPRVILTAAHCVPTEPLQITLAFGQNPISGRYTPRAADATIIHAQYSKNDFNDRNDLALIRFKGDLPTGYKAALRPPSTFPMAAGYSFTAAGYGRTTGQKKEDSGILRNTELRIEMMSANTRQFRVDQTGGRGVCSGDSGGPALMRFQGNNYIVGVASAVWWTQVTQPADTCRHKAIYMNLKAYQPWLDENLIKILKK